MAMNQHALAAGAWGGMGLDIDLVCSLVSSLLYGFLRIQSALGRADSVLCEVYTVLTIVTPGPLACRFNEGVWVNPLAHRPCPEAVHQDTYSTNVG